MNKFLCIIFIIFISLISFAQGDSLKRFSFGGKVLPSKSYFYGQDNLSSFGFGATASFKYSKNNSISTEVGLLYSTRNLIDWNPPNGDAGFRLGYNYLELPLFLLYQPLGYVNWKIRPIISTGLMPALLISSKSYDSGYVYNQYKWNIFKGYHSRTPLDVSLVEGLGADIHVKKHHLYLGLQAQYGMVELKGGTEDIQQFNSAYGGKRFYNAYSIVISFYY